MKTTSNLSYAVHKTFEKGPEGKRSTLWYISTGDTVKCLDIKQTDKFIESLRPNTILRMTQVNNTDAQLLDAVKRGVTIMYANWHKLGIQKNQDAETIVKFVANAPSTMFREFIPNIKIAELRDALSLRNALDQFYDDAMRKFQQVGRNRVGYETLIEHVIKENVKELNNVYDGFKVMGENTNGKVKELTLENQVIKLAKAIPECVLFNKICGMKEGWITAAGIVANAGSMDRFSTVASFWHYCGMHVVDGKAPKRQKGSPVTWSPEIRKVLYNLGENIQKNVNNKWNQYFKEMLAFEIDSHDSRCTCKFKMSHAYARARRKTVKEILKRFFIEAKGEEFKSGYVYGEAHRETTALGASAGND